MNEIIDLVSRAQSGDSLGFKGLYELHVGRVFRACNALLGDPNLAEDATQHVFSQAFSKIRSFEGRSSFSTWLHGFAVRITSNMRRGLSRRTKAMETLHNDEVRLRVHAQSPEDVAREREFVAKIEQALQGIAEHKRSVFILHHVLELSLSDVARAMGASRQTTAARLKAVRRELVELLVGQELQEPSCP